MLRGIQFAILVDLHFIVFAHEVFGEFEEGFVYPKCGIYDVKLTGKGGIRGLSTIHPNAQNSTISGVLVAAEVAEAVGKDGGVGQGRHHRHG